MTDHIVLYGKGGAGTSSLTSNVSAALVEAGFRVLQIGCSPKGDSSAILNGGFHRMFPLNFIQNEQKQHIGLFYA